MSALQHASEDHLIPPEFLATLSKEEREEALAAAAAAKRAEERAEERALQRALKEREESRRIEREREQQEQQPQSQGIRAASKVAFVSKRQRGQLNDKDATTDKPSDTKSPARVIPVGSIPESESFHQSAWNEDQRLAIHQSYLGKRAVVTEEESIEERRKAREKKKITFKFQWDNTEDTSRLDQDDLYSEMLPKIRPAIKRRRVTLEDMPSADVSLETVKNKPLQHMTKRDWRIFRENYDIVVKGGKAPPPLRRFDESSDPNVPAIHTSLLQALFRTLKFKEPSPIQRQAIPIGMQRRDLIGIAETGSGKTVAFGVPLCHFILTLPPTIQQRVADEGPLAIVIAPTRELALQIDAEFQKLLSFAPHIISIAVVGGQPIQQQAQKLRHGVHIVVGTPGRINDCLEMTYMVLNQCCYVVLDEFDRTLDMGFLPQTTSILDAMGGRLKSENEEETYEQERRDLLEMSLPKHRVTAIKRKALRDILNRQQSMRDKIMVFVNEKKHAEGVKRMVERAGRRCVVLHGGKSQDQREENLADFRQGGVVLVATDVAGRGLDIADVTHVINFDLPTRSIDNYSHRIGRTGRAGKDGLATSFITDEDEGIMADLKRYLESTGNEVPERLARHPAATGGHGKNIM
ncbi:DEAD box helicase-like protein [Fragilaria crotonensis]|nr:DEAD box helicase-like protein [Fragilaria crotonensis]